MSDLLWKAWHRSRYQNPIPEHVREEVRQRANGKCEGEVCGETGHALEMHHVRYTCDDGKLIFGRETKDDLLHLCRTCHKMAHHSYPGGDYFLDPVECKREQEKLRELDRIAYDSPRYVEIKRINVALWESLNSQP